jgi:hypothetical protein
MKFALELEAQTLGFYENASELVSVDERKQIFLALKDGCAKRIKTLERIRRENVTEMILEPIKGLDNELYTLNLDISESLDDASITASAKAIEETRKHFYEKGSLKIEFLIEAATAFDRLADENQDNIDTLQMAQ